MTEKRTEEIIDRPPVGNLTDFVEGVGKDDYLHVDVTIKEDGGVVIFHSHPFKKDLSWMEFDLNDSKLDFILDNGEVRDAGLPLKKEVAKYMQNAHQILMVLMNPETGEAEEGHYVPLIIHQK